MPEWYRGGVTTLQNAAAALADGAAANCKGASRVTLFVSGAGGWTVNFEGTLDDTNWFAVGLKTAADGAAQTTATQAQTGAYKRPPDLALSQIRARVSAFTSGTATVVALVE